MGNPSWSSSGARIARIAWEHITDGGVPDARYDLKIALGLKEMKVFEAHTPPKASEFLERVLATQIGPQPIGYNALGLH